MYASLAMRLAQRWSDHMSRPPFRSFDQDCGVPPAVQTEISATVRPQPSDYMGAPPINMRVLPDLVLSISSASQEQEGDTKGTYRPLMAVVRG